MDLASASALMSVAVGGMTLVAVVFRGGRTTQKIDHMDASLGRLESKLDIAVERLEQRLDNHIQEGTDHNAIVGERLARLEARRES